MKITEIAFTSYAATDFKRARKFYEEVLGLKQGSLYEKGHMGFVEYEIGPHTLVVGAGAPSFKPGVSGATVAIETDDFDGMLAKIKASGVEVLMDKQETSVCFMALFKDTEGNQLMLHHRKAQ